MNKQLFIALQYLTPQLLLSKLMGWFSNQRLPWLKNYMITRFIKRYQVNLKEALIENPEEYATFNQFFIRKLKPTIRPICPEENGIASPVDGLISAIGTIENDQLLQAKNHSYTLKNLLGGDQSLAKNFASGTYATLYLAPHDYHRVHIPLGGELQETIFVPGKLFSVNILTSENVPQLFSRNERLISIFNTSAGKMAVILVGAMIVGNIQMVWQNTPSRQKKPYKTSYSSNEIKLSKGDELGHFKLGSTVILLFQANQMEWLPAMQINKSVKLGECIGRLKTIGLLR